MNKEKELAYLKQALSDYQNPSIELEKYMDEGLCKYFQHKHNIDILSLPVLSLKVRERVETNLGHTVASDGAACNHLISYSGFYQPRIDVLKEAIKTIEES